MSNDIVVVDNFLHKVQQKEIETLIVNDNNIFWNYHHNASYGGNVNELQFCKNDPEIYVKKFGNISHTLLNPNGTASNINQLFPNFKTLIETKFNVRVKKLVRSRINLMFPIGEVTSKYDTPHTDIYPFPTKETFNHKSVVYYVNDSDGDTILFNEIAYNGDPLINTNKKTLIQRVTPKQGRAVMFDSNRYHAGSFPSKNIRIVLNINFLLEDE